MKPLTAEWVAKAEADRHAAAQLVNAEPVPWDVVCFLAQQCAEKYLKAHLHEASVAFPKTHDLAVLLALIAAPPAALCAMRSDLDALSGLAVNVRYPGHNATEQIGMQALATADKVRGISRTMISLSPT